MKYAQARGLIKSGDALIFPHPTGSIRSWYDFQIRMLQLYQISTLSHVAIAWAEYDRVLMLEAVSSGVRPYSLSKCLPFYWIPNPVPLSEEAKNWLWEKIGTPYPNKIKMALNALGFDMSLETDSRLDCSEYFKGAMAVNKQPVLAKSEPASICEELERTWGARVLVEA